MENTRVELVKLVFGKSGPKEKFAYYKSVVGIPLFILSLMVCIVEVQDQVG